MASWILRDLAQSGDRTFARPLGLNEHAFYWDSQFDRTADCIRHAVVEARADRANDLFGTGNVSRTWASLKQHFPLLGSKFEEPAEGGGSVHFVVIEKTLRDTGPEELHFASIASFKEAEDLVDSLLDGSMECPSNPLAQLYILRRTDQPNYFHIIFRAVHAITDGTSNINILRTFLDILSSPLDSFEVPNLVDRLAMAVSVDELHPGLQSSLSVQRWRRAIVYVLHSIRLSKSKGGQTLPRNLTPTTQSTPARSRNIAQSFPPDASMRIIENCRKHQVTFGNAFLVLGQVAFSRVLHRRYLRGEISQEEWEFRRREPMFSGGPINLRPYLSKAWLDKGGSHGVGLFIGGSLCKLPFMPLGLASTQDRQAANLSLSDLLSPERFFLRCHLVKQQMARAIKIPLLPELFDARMTPWLQSRKRVALEWRNIHKEGRQDAETMAVPSPFTYISAFAATTMGNIDALLPQKYPLPSMNPWRTSDRKPPPSNSPQQRAPAGTTMGDTILQLHDMRTHLRCRPGELYLYAITVNKRLQLNTFWDGNVYKEEIVQEWFNEIKNATDWYLVHD